MGQATLGRDEQGKKELEDALQKIDNKAKEEIGDGVISAKAFETYRKKITAIRKKFEYGDY